jgi:hypothetical protein
MEFLISATAGVRVALISINSSHPVSCYLVCHAYFALDNLKLALESKHLLASDLAQAYGSDS